MKRRGMSRKVAVFQYGVVLSQLGYLVRCLAEAGYAVDVFLHKSSMEFFQISDDERVRVHLSGEAGEQAGTPGPRGLERLKSRVEGTWVEPLAVRARTLLRKLTPESLLPDASRLIPSSIVDEAVRVVAGGDYACLIGVEKPGLLWAGLVGERTGVPWMYYSLELFTSDNPAYYEFDLVRYAKAEKYYHQRAAATIIQDRDRAEVLLGDNEVEGRPVIFLPVSVMGEARGKSDYLRVKHGIPAGAVVVLQFGHVHERRSCREAMLAAGNFEEGVFLVVHGKFPEGMEEYASFSSDRVILSDTMVPPSELGELISSADIGLALYSELPLNDSLTGSASEKLALYLQAGLPVVMFDRPSFVEVNERYRFGVCIKELEELPAAVRTILDDYETFRENAFKAFVDHYEFRRGFEKVLSFIENLETPEGH